MNAKKVIELARKHLGYGTMEISARLCLSDAIYMYDHGDLDTAKTRALASLAYSVGVHHEDYRRAAK